MSVVKATFDAYELKNIASIFKSLYNEVNFVFTRDQLVFTIIDTSKMCAFNASLTPKSYDNLTDNLHVFGVLLSNLYTFLRSSKRGENIAFELNDKDNQLKMWIQADNEEHPEIVTKKCILHNIIIPVVNLTIPYHSYVVKADISYTTMHAIISAIAAFNNTFVLNMDKGKIMFSSGHQQTDILSYQLPHDMEWKEYQLLEEGQQLHHEYEIKYLNNFLKKKISDNVVIRITNDGTLLVQFIWGTSDLVLLLSPINTSV